MYTMDEAFCKEMGAQLAAHILETNDIAHNKVTLITPFNDWAILLQSYLENIQFHTMYPLMLGTTTTVEEFEAEEVMEQ